MELKLNVDVANVSPEIKFNYEELSAAIREGLVKYDSVTVTEETFKDAKSDRAKINKMIKALKDEKKSVKDSLLAPMDAFGKQIDALVGMCNSVLFNIDEGIKRIEEDRKRTKAQAITAIAKGIIEKTCGNDYDVFIGEWITENEKWLNVTYKIDDIAVELNAFCESVKKGEETIRTMYKDKPDLLAVAVNYYKQNAVVEEVINKVAEFIQSQSVAKSVEPVVQSEPVAVAPSASEKKYEVTIAFRGSVEQLKSLRSYIEKSGLVFIQLGKMTEVK